jgi:hypothetical protein
VNNLDEIQRFIQRWLVRPLPDNERSDGNENC